MLGLKGSTWLILQSILLLVGGEGLGATLRGKTGELLEGAFKSHFQDRETEYRLNVWGGSSKTATRKG